MADEGDNNTKFFHSVANARRTNNHISALTIDGNLCADPLKIEEEILQFFKQLYTKKSK